MFFMKLHYDVVQIDLMSRQIPTKKFHEMRDISAEQVINDRKSSFPVQNTSNLERKSQILEQLVKIWITSNKKSKKWHFWG